MAKKKKDIEAQSNYQEDIRVVDYLDEMRSSYIDYSLSVITERALPDIRDGLKPVHRRILYGMKCLGLKHNLPYKKSARIVGEVMGKFHPHGDASIYDAMAHMAQEWYYIHPLVDGHGNFGSIEGDEQAASRYTEARLSAIAEELFLQDLEKGIVNFVPNFDDNEYEPSILPVKVPNILLSGTEGIAVGMASKIPTHNLGEIIDGVIATMDNAHITTTELLQYIKGPDFSTGGIVSNAEELVSIYENGAGKIRIRGKATIVDVGSGRFNIVITEIPQTMIGQIDKFMETVANLVYTKTLTEIDDIKNFSGKEGIKIVVELKKNANAQKVLNILYKKAKLEDTFGYNAMAICDGCPKQLGLKEILTQFITFNSENYSKRYNYLLNAELRQQEIKEGLIKAISCVDTIIEILRGAHSIADAKECLMKGDIEKIVFKTKAAEKQAKKLSFTEQQANAILDMKLQRLVGLEIMVLEKELQQHVKNIAHYTALLKSKTKMQNQIKKDLIDIKNRYATQRKTAIVNAEEIEITKNEVVEETMYVVIDKFGYTKALDEATYERNIENINQYKYCIKMKNTDKLCILTDANKCHYIKGLQIPSGKFKDKGVMLNTISNYSNNETILLIQPLSSLMSMPLIFVNEDGMVKIVNGNEFEANKKTIDSTKKDSGKLIGVLPLKTEKDIALQTQNGFFVRFKIEEISEMKKTAIGVRGIKLSPNDRVIAAKIGNSKTEISEIPFSSIKLTKRDAVGTQKSKRS